jgi:hypothetical protein
VRLPGSDGKGISSHGHTAGAGPSGKPPPPTQGHGIRGKKTLTPLPYRPPKQSHPGKRSDGHGQCQSD